MKSFRIFSAVTLIGCLVFSSGASAVVDSNAPVVKLRDAANGGCAEAGTTLNNCFTDISALSSWIWDTRKPTNTSPLVVEIGPGTFGQFPCGDAVSSIAGRISFHGAGMDKTTLASVTLLGQCANVAFDNMTIGGTGVSYGVVVVNPGTQTTWTNVKLAGSWQEYCNGGSGGGRHNWFGSQIALTNGGYYQVKCDQSWFYGSEITSKGNLTQAEVTTFLVNGAELHVYGSVIRALGTGTGTPSSLYPLTAVYANAGAVHIHGTGIDAITINGAPASVTALWAENGAMIHANETAYNLSSGTGGTVTRILNNGGHVHAPYLWEHIPDATTIPNYTSVTGADITTVTTGTSDGHPHTVIYDSSCASKWYDAVDKACRP